MSIFKDAISSHEKGIQDKQAAIQQAVADREAQEVKFKKDFEEAVDTVAYPLFKQFAEDVQEMGFPSKVDRGLDGNKKPYLSVEFVPVKGATISPVHRHEVSVYVLKADAQVQKVEHLLYYDQRAGRPHKNVGTHTYTFGLPSINADVLKKHLLEVLQDAMKSRETRY